ncbi:TAXI family TRAP transporter solute-binding subunit [Curvivirga sp.]|uniref:TAXI family TRAP transporter solute-binding subunit n=1 Tax=Curvivirga sp. TaxID=2856848 RepID=UPI003B5AE3FD
MFRRSVLSLLLIFSSFVIATSSSANNEEKLKFFRIGAGPTSETLYALGTAISASISRPPGTLPCDQLGGVCGVPGLIAVAQSKSGSIENLEDLRFGEVDSALVRSDVANQAFKGIGPFLHVGENENLRVIANMSTVSAHIVVRADSDIYTVKDLHSKTVSIGAKGSGTLLFVRSLLQAHDMDMYNIRYREMFPGAAADALLNETIDVAVIIGAAPIPAIESLAQNINLRFIPIEGQGREKLKRIYAHLHDAEIEQTAYDQEAVIPTVAIWVQWIVNVTADMELIEDITQALWQSETEEFFVRNNPEHEFPKQEDSLPNGIIPTHPGAENYYKSAGLM